ncbi:MAG: hypothetical protein HC799_07705 [Limnothrix sp. RL_2_0]|nr:hypothetical protein [Limnothrix sp. RL_2_0]
MAQSTIQDRVKDCLPLDTQVEYLSIQAELELLFQQIRSNQQSKVAHKA